MKVKIEKMSLLEKHITVEYSVIGQNVVGRLRIPVEDCSDEKIKQAIHDDLASKQDAIDLLKQLKEKYSGEEIEV